MSNLQLPNFFISYARKDERIVRQLIKLVTISGGFIFFDQDDIQPGMDWREALAEALVNSDSIIVFWSQNANNSDWVRREWEYGIEIGKRVIPVQIDNTDLPKELSRLQAIDLRVMQTIQGMVPKQIYRSLLGEWKPDELSNLLGLAATKLMEEIPKF